MRHVVGIASLLFGVWLTFLLDSSARVVAESNIKALAMFGVFLAGALAWKRPRATAALLLVTTLILALGPTAAGTSKYFMTWSLLNAGVAAILTLLAIVAVLNRDRAQAESVRQAESRVIHDALPSPLQSAAPLVTPIPRAAAPLTNLERPVATTDTAHHIAALRQELLRQRAAYAAEQLTRLAEQADHLLLDLTAISIYLTGRRIDENEHHPARNRLEQSKLRNWGVGFNAKPVSRPNDSLQIEDR